MKNKDRDCAIVKMRNEGFKYKDISSKFNLSYSAIKAAERRVHLRKHNPMYDLNFNYIRKFSDAGCNNKESAHSHFVNCKSFRRSFTEKGKQAVCEWLGIDYEPFNDSWMIPDTSWEVVYFDNVNNVVTLIKSGFTTSKDAADFIRSNNSQDELLIRKVSYSKVKERNQVKNQINSQIEPEPEYKEGDSVTVITSSGEKVSGKVCVMAGMNQLVLMENSGQLHSLNNLTKV